MAKKKIVVIDDEKDLALFIKVILEETGVYQVAMAYDGAEGEKLCSSEKPDLIFLDFVMPGKRGDDVLATLRKDPQFRRTPVVIISGLGEIVFVQKTKQWRWLPNRPIVRNRGVLPDALAWEKEPEKIAAKMNVQGFLSKPFTSDALLAAVEQVFLAQQIVPQQDPGGDSMI